MADNKDDTFRTVFGIQRGTTASTVSDVIGGALMSAGLLGAISEYGKMKSFEEMNKGITTNINTVYDDFTKNIAATKAGFEGALTTHTNTMVDNIKADVLARGMDSKVGETSATQYRASTSGAYAAARAALEAAKFTAQTQMDKAKVGYYTNMAEMNLKSSIAKKAAEIGIWGALGGMTVAGTKAALRKGDVSVPKATTIEDVGNEEPAPEYANPDQAAEEGA